MKGNVEISRVPIVHGCGYNPLKDISPVDQFGFVDLRDAFVNASIPGDLNVDEAGYNGVDDPASLVGRSSDVFDSYRKASAVKAAEAAKASTATPKSESE